MRSISTRELLAVRLGPDRVGDVEVSLRGLETVRDGDRRLLGDEVRETGVGQGDHRHLRGHRLGNGQAESLAARRMHVAVGQVVEAADLSIAHVAVDPPDVRRVRVAGSEPLEDLTHPVVGIREGLQDQRHVAPAVERGEVGLEQHVDALAREGRADVEEGEAPEILELGRLDSRLRIGRLDSVADHPDRDVDPRIAQHVPDERRRHPYAVEVPVEVVHHRFGYPALLPSEVLASDPSGCVDHPRREHLADHDVGEGHLPRPIEEARRGGMRGKVLPLRLVVTRPLGRVHRQCVLGVLVETLGEPAVHHRKAVARLERPLDLDLERRQVPDCPIDDSPEHPLGVEAPDVVDPRELALEQPSPDLGVRLHCMDGRRDDRRLLGPEQHAGTAHRLGDGSGTEGDHRHPRGHRLEDRDPESLVLTQRDEDAGAAERRSQLTVGDLAEQDHPIGETGLGSGPADLCDVVLRRQVPDEHEPRVGVEVPHVEGERGDQLVLALVTDQPTHVQPVVRGMIACTIGPVRRGELAEVHSHRQHLDPVKACRQHVAPVEVGDGDTEESPLCEHRQLFPALPDVTANAGVREVPFGRHVVVHDDHVVRDVDDVVERVVADRVVDQQQLGARTGESVDRSDPILQPDRDVLGEDLRPIPHLTQQRLEFEHLVGDRVTEGRSRVELVDRLVSVHLVATMT